MATKKKQKASIGDMISGLILPGLFVMAWIFALSGSSAPGAVAGEALAISYLKWLLYFAGYVFIASSIMHSVLAKKTAQSIGWITNGFQYEIAFVSLGLGIASFYAVYHGWEAWVAVSIPIITFLFLAGLNHLKEMVKDKNYAPNNSLILIWDFGLPISLAMLLWVIAQ